MYAVLRLNKCGLFSRYNTQEELLTPRPTPKLEDHPLSAAQDY
jgi:hypothetical protein